MDKKMVEPSGHNATYRCTAGSLDLASIERHAADMWSDLAFDENALARLRRDGLALDGVRLTGPSPYRIVMERDADIVVTITDHPDAAVLIDLWRLHFMKGLRPGSIAA